LLDVLQALFTTNERRSLKLTLHGLLEVDSGQFTSHPELNLLNHCELEEGLTLKDIFNYVDKHELLKEFIKMYSWCSPIDKLHAAAEEVVKEQDLWSLEVHGYGEHYDKHSSLGIYMYTFHGIGALGEDTAKYYDENPDKQRPDHDCYGVGMSPMGTIAHLPVKLSDEFSITCYGQKHTVVQRIHATPRYTLLDILDAIYWEISFYGGPEEALDMRDTLCQRMKEVEDGTVETKSWDEVKENLRIKDWDEED